MCPESGGVEDFFGDVGHNGSARRRDHARVMAKEDEPAEMVDSVAGAVVSAAAVLLVAWMVASPLASSPFPQVSGQVRQSALVQAVDRAVPDEVRAVYEDLREAIDRGLITEADVDAGLAPLLRTLVRLGFFDPPEDERPRPGAASSTSSARAEEEPKSVERRCGE